MANVTSVAAAAAEMEHTLRRAVAESNLRSFDATSAWTTLMRLNGAAVADAPLWSAIVRTRARVLLRLCLQQTTAARQLTYLQPCIGAWVALKDVDANLAGRELMHVWEHALSLELAASARGNAADFQQVIQMLQECLKRVEPLHPVYVDYVRALCRYGEALNKHASIPTARTTQVRCLAQACAVSLALLEKHFEPSATAALGYDKYGIVLPAYNDRMSFADAMTAQTMDAGAYAASEATSRGAMEEDWICMREAAPTACAGLSGEEDGSPAAKVSPENVLRYRVALLAAKALWMLQAAGGDLDLIRAEHTKILRWVSSVTSIPVAEPSARSAAGAAVARAQLWQVMFGCFMLARDCAPEPMAAADVALDLHDASVEFMVAHAVMPLRGTDLGMNAPSLRAGPGMAPALLRMLQAQRSSRRHTLDSASVASCEDGGSLRASLDGVSPVADAPTAAAAGTKRTRDNAMVTRGDASTVTDVSIMSTLSSFSVTSAASCAGSSPTPALVLSAQAFSPVRAAQASAVGIDDAASTLSNIMERHMSITSPSGQSKRSGAHADRESLVLLPADAMDLDVDVTCAAPATACPSTARTRMPPAARRLCETLIIMLDNDAFTLERSLAAFGVFRTSTGFVDMAGPDAGLSACETAPASSSASPITSTHAFPGSPHQAFEPSITRKRGRFDESAAAADTGAARNMAAAGTDGMDVSPSSRVRCTSSTMDIEDDTPAVASPPRAATDASTIGSPLRATAFKTRSPGAAVATAPRTAPVVPGLARSLTFEEGDDDLVSPIPTPIPVSPVLPSSRSIMRSSSVSSNLSSGRPRARVRWSSDVLQAEDSRRRLRIASFDDFVYGADGVALSCPTAEDAGDGYITSCTVAQPAFTPILPAGPLLGLPAPGRAVATLRGAWPLRVPSARCVPSMPPAHSPLSPSFAFRIWQLRCALEPHPRDNAAATAAHSSTLPALSSPSWTGVMLPPSPLLQGLTSRLSECDTIVSSPRTALLPPPATALIDDDDSRDAVVIALKRALEAAVSELERCTDDMVAV